MTLQWQHFCLAIPCGKEAMQLPVENGFGCPDFLGVQCGLKGPCFVVQDYENTFTSGTALASAELSRYFRQKMT